MTPFFVYFGRQPVAAAGSKMDSSEDIEQVCYHNMNSCN